MILYGAGGHANVVISCLEENNIKVFGIFDDNPNLTDFGGINLFGEYERNIMTDEKIIISIGDNVIRKRISDKIEHEFGYVFHPSATVDRLTEIGEGSVIFHKSVIQRHTSIGKHVIINTASSVDHDCKIGDFVHIAPNSTLCGDVIVGTGTLIGAGSVIKPGIRIGNWCTIGVGAVVLKDIPDYSVIIGNPGRIIKKNNFEL